MMAAHFNFSNDWRLWGNVSGISGLSIGQECDISVKSILVKMFQGLHVSDGIPTNKNHGSRHS